MKNNDTKERITEEIVTYNRKRTYKQDQPKSNSLMNYGKMNSIKLYIQHENECYELLSTNTSNNIENQQKYEAVQRQKSIFHKIECNINQSEKEDNDALDLCDKHDSDELNGLVDILQQNTITTGKNCIQILISTQLQTNMVVDYNIISEMLNMNYKIRTNAI